MPVAAIGAIVGGGAILGGQALSLIEQGKARKAQKRQFEFERSLANNRVARERRDAIRAGRIAAANINQGAANTGSSLSSAFLGGFGSIRSQVNGNLSFLDTNQSLADQAANETGKAIKAQGRAQLFQQISNIGKQVFSAAGGGGI